MSVDPFKDFKKMQSQAWGLFAPLEYITTSAAAHLIKFASIRSGQKVFDAACGTGVTTITAARRGATVTGLDLAPALLERAHQNAATAAVKVDLLEGDVEALPFEDGSFDVVISQFGHMFAPRPDVAAKELLRVLRKGGTLAFSTWPPELYTGQMFALVAKYVPPPEGVPPVTLWGDPATIKSRLGEAVEQVTFDRRTMLNPSLSPQHTRRQFEETAAPLIKLTQALKAENPAKLEQFRSELESLVAAYSEDNYLHQSFLMTRAIKR